jgi:hypothetical protein
MPYFIKYYFRHQSQFHLCSLAFVQFVVIANIVTDGVNSQTASTFHFIALVCSSMLSDVYKSGEYQISCISVCVLRCLDTHTHTGLKNRKHIEFSWFLSQNSRCLREVTYSAEPLIEQHVRDEEGKFPGQIEILYWNLSCAENNLEKLQDKRLTSRH